MSGTVQIRAVAAVVGAVVIAVFCTVLVTEAWFAEAAPGDADSTFVPTAGCRLMDTRPAPGTVGLRSAPLGAGDVYEVIVHGSNGECTGALAVPTDAVGVALNVTAVNATATSNIRVYPANLSEVPLLSNLNVSAGASPTPNKVDVKLSPDGKIKVYNFRGSVNIIIDIVGYYTNSTLQELSQRVVDLETAQAAGVDPTVLARIDALETTTATNTSGIAALDVAQPFAVTARTDRVFVDSGTVVVAVAVTAPAAGQVTVNSTTNARFTAAGEHVRCWINDSIFSISDPEQRWESPGLSGGESILAGTRTFDIAAGATSTYNLFCTITGDESFLATMSNSVLTAIFTPAP